MTHTLARPSTVAGPQPVAVPRDRFKRPLIHVPGKDKPVPYTRCTTFVDCIEDKSALSSWGKRMVLLGAGRNPQTAAQAVRLDPATRDGKSSLDELAERLVNTAGANDRRRQGTRLHELSEYVDGGQPMPSCTPMELADMAAYKAATVMLDVVHTERLVVLDDLKVAGTPDRISFYDGPGPDGEPLTGHLITDLKTGSLEYGALKMAMQLAVYSRGQFYDPASGTRTPLPQVNQDWGLIIHLAAGTAACTVHWINLTVGWRGVQLAQDVRSLRRSRGLLTPLSSGAATGSRLAA